MVHVHKIQQEAKNIIPFIDLYGNGILFSILSKQKLKYYSLSK